MCDMSPLEILQRDHIWAVMEDHAEAEAKAMKRRLTTKGAAKKYSKSVMSIIKLQTKIKELTK